MSAVADPAAGPRTGGGAPCDGAMIDDLGWALGVVFRSYARAASLAFSELPGGPRGYQVLAAAARGEPGNQLKLAQHLGVDRTVMTYLLDKLENAGLIAPSHAVPRSACGPASERAVALIPASLPRPAVVTKILRLDALSYILSAEQSIIGSR